MSDYYLPMDGSPFTTDITFCDTVDCPFIECQRHSENLKGQDRSTIVSMANFGGVCMKYNGWLVFNAENTRRDNIRKEVFEQLG